MNCIKLVLLSVFIIIGSAIFAQQADKVNRQSIPVMSSLAFGGSQELNKLFSDIDSVGRQFEYGVSDFVKYSEIGSFCTQKAIQYFNGSNFPSAEVYFYAALYIYVNLPDARKTAFVLNFLGTTHMHQGDFDTALERYLQSLSIYESYGNVHGASNVYINIGVLYKSLKEYDRALEYYFFALEKKKQINHSEGVAAAYANIAVIYNDMEEYDKSLEYQFKTLNTYKKMDNMWGVAVTYNNLASYYIDLDMLDEASKYCQLSYDLNQEYGGKRDLTLNILNFASIYFRQGHYQKARIYAENGLEESRQMGTTDLDIPIYELLVNICDSLGDFESAYMYQKLYYAFKDNVMGQQIQAQIEKLDLRFQNQKKEATIEAQRFQILERDLRINRRNTVIYLGIVLLLLLIAFFAFWLYRVRTMRQRELNELLLKDEKQKSKEIIDAVEEERQRIARDLHDGLGQNLAAIKLGMLHVSESLGNEPEVQKKLRDNIEFIDQTYRETRNLSHQMMPKALFSLGLIDAMHDLSERVFSNAGIKFSFDYNFDIRFSQKIEIGIYRIFQELCNNIIKHAKASHVDISLLRTNEQLTLIVEDNGIGFDRESLKTKGIGLQNMQNRANVLNGSIELNSAPGKGATALLRIPLAK
ncbi:MAG: sensor histidine kinase [Bacteroidales bacterium]|nr:sensor histidine kinase [Bacteroidales bacterium]